MARENMVYLYNGILFRNETNEILTHANRSQTQTAMYFMIYKTYPEQGNPQRHKVDYRSLGAEGEGNRE